MLIGEKLKNLREEKNYTQKYVAEQISCSARMISLYENNKCNVNLDMLVSLCKFYNVNCDYMLGITTDKRNYLSLSKQQNRLLELFSKLNNIEKQEIIELLEFKLSRK